MMKFSARLTLSTVAPAVLFSTALVVSLVGMFRVEHTYAGLLAREERLAAGASSLYAEGLQMGQALRNIVLDPADTKAQDNLQKAAENFEQRYQEMRPLAQGTPIEPMLAEVGTLRAQHREVQQAVLAALAADPASAVSTLKQKETPAWRALRAKVMDLASRRRTCWPGLTARRRPPRPRPRPGRWGWPCWPSRWRWSRCCWPGAPCARPWAASPRMRVGCCAASPKAI
jgi:hypothetical protein